ncbi:hypothetical protein HQ487_05070 [Candidatus Uhrbacteria bacterium]|nr:hypothetical protein [Candidatus Uhrbacteria bacterium]
MLKRRGESPTQERRSHRELKEDQDILSIRTILLSNGQEMSFYHNESMDPVESAWEPSDFPIVFQEIIRERESAMKNFYSLKETVTTPEWKANLFRFLSDYLEHEGSSLLESLSIVDIHQLSPSQIIKLSTKLVTGLMKYDRASLESGESQKPPTREDNMSILEILTEGRVHMGTSEDWEGNGVCRNYAAAEYGVFEALKTAQEQGSQIEQMVCLVVVGTEHLPMEVEKVAQPETTHAWNIFLLTPQQGEVHVSIIDPTWTATEESHKSNPQRQSDYTFQRMEGFIFTLGSAVEKVDRESWKAVSVFYKSMLEKYSGRSAPEAQAKRNYYVYRFLLLVENIIDLSDQRPGIQELKDQIRSEYTTLLSSADTIVSKPLGPRLRILAAKEQDDLLMSALKKFGNSKAHKNQP